MFDDIALYIETMKESMDKSMTFFEKELEKLRAGKANVKMLDGVKVDYYGTMTLITQVANLSVSDSKQIMIQPWEKNMIVPIEKAIMAANLGFNPQNNGEMIRVVVPTLTEERRKDLAKKARQEAEQVKVTIRNQRRTTNNAIKELKDEGAPEDEIKKAEAIIQKITDDFIEKTDKYLEFKEKEIMTI